MQRTGVKSLNLQINAASMNFEIPISIQHKNCIKIQVETNQIYNGSNLNLKSIFGTTN